MNYKRHYDLLITTRQVMNRKRQKNDGYHNHHIIPKSLGGNNSKLNLILLTPKEHFIAHLLLLMIYKQNYNINSEAYNNYRKMSYAFWNMCGSRNKLTSINSRSYKFALETKKELSVWIVKENIQKFIPHYDLEKFLLVSWKRGRLPHSEDTINSIRNSKSGLIWITKNDIQTTIKQENLQSHIIDGWEIGRKEFTEDHKNNIKNSLIGRELSVSHKKNIGNGTKGKVLGPLNDEHRKRLGKPIVVYDIKYDGLAWAAKELNTTKMKIFYMLHNKELTDCYYL